MIVKQQIHLENCQESKMEFYLGNSLRLKPTSHFRKKNFLSDV